MQPFATVAQYEARYGTVTATTTLQACLEDATAMIQAALEAAGVDYSTPTAEYADRLMRVCRQIAHRAMDATPPAGGIEAPFGVSQATQSAGGYSLSYSFANPYGDLFITSSERRMLGIGGVHFSNMRPYITPTKGRGGGWSHGAD